MTPVALLALGAAAGGAWWLFEKNKKANVPGQVPGQMPGLVNELSKGRSYTVLLVITKDITDDPRWNSFPAGTPNEERIKQLISATFMQSGCKMLSQPTIRNQQEMQKAIAGEPSTWVFNMQWLLDDKFITRQIPWMAGASFFLLPIQ